ncbi:MAG: CBS domain-containing protein [Candidatus Zixiibacteriota bacterium]|nr:MAG: CBS domain-containing protein [candidate division Zixibacteria bacterium]
MLVKSILETKAQNVITARPSNTLHEAMDMLIKNKIGCLPVVDDNEKIIGIISDTDIFRKIHETEGKYQSLKVSDLMTKELIVGLPTDELDYIAGVMEKNYIRHVPIVDDDHVIGIVSLRDIHKTYVRNKEIETRYLMDMLEKRDKSGDI